MPHKTAAKRSGASADRVLDAAARLLGAGKGDFTMRQLAAEAGVSFATPFNQFGSKGAIMQALSARLIDRMEDSIGESQQPDYAPGRVLLAFQTGVEVMLESPAVNRALMGALGTPGPVSGDVAARSARLWQKALGDAAGFVPVRAALAVSVLPDQLALAFRGALSFWAAGEISDDDLPVRARTAAAALMLGFVAEDRRGEMLAILAGA